MTDSHKEVFLTKPAAGSRYEFFVEGFSILAADEVPTLSFVRIPVPEDVDTETNRAIQRSNRRSASLVSAIEQEADDLISRLGLPSPATDNHAAEELRNRLILSTQLALHLTVADAHESAGILASSPREEGYSRTLCQDVIQAADLVQGQPGPKALATYLNANAWTRGRSDALDPDHVARALSARKKRVARQCIGYVGPLWRSIVSLEFDTLVEQFRALEILLERAKDKTELKAKRGAELAREIHSRFDLHDCVERAGAMQQVA